ncbi:hypothetical protein BDN72DRAFT_962862 [Pluteus cervinus]|uniref:Uncharacterized protein n=1 Tax=Pluteus cervinus TaxID=181527 RepID=A0ACD3AI62_9AGAR|nr:hypothetical protein BDN72DRAFT_962862 [Pluteus cervinus]
MELQTTPSSFETSTDIPILPNELQREILELAARASRSTAIKLLALSKKVFIWIQPLLYEVIVVQQSEPTNTSSRADDVEAAPYVAGIIKQNIEQRKNRSVGILTGHFDSLTLRPVAKVNLDLQRRLGLIITRTLPGGKLLRKLLRTGTGDTGAKSRSCSHRSAGKS